MILTNCRSRSLFFHSENGKGFMTLGLRRTFSHFNELLKCDSFYCRVTYSCLCFQYLPPLRATGFLFEEVSPVPSALSVIGFFPWRAVQLWAHLDKTLVFGFLTKYLWGLSPGRADGPGTGAGQGSSKRVRIISYLSADCYAPCTLLSFFLSCSF